MTLPVTIPNTFANATTSIPLANLDANFTTIYAAVNGIGNGAETLANVQVTGGTLSNVTLDNVTVDVETLSNVTLVDVTVTSGNATFTTANATTIDTTNIEVTNIKAKDGTASVAIADSTGAVTVSTLLNVDNLRLDGNTISSTDTNGNIVLAPNGSGRVQVSGTASNAGGIELFEDADNGTNKALLTAPASLAADVTVTLPSQTATLGYLNIPPVGTKTGSYTLATTDVGEYVQVGSGGSITIPNATFAEGDAISIFNNTSGNITITCSITTAYIAGTDADKASVTLATRGVCTVLFISSTVCVITGNVS